MQSTEDIRNGFANAQCIVVKVGSRVLVQANGRPDRRRLRSLVTDISACHRTGKKIALVSSGAISAGMEALRWKTRPQTIPNLQMAAAVGQSRLMTIYDRFFAERSCRIGQVLLTHDDLKHRQRHLNARHTLTNLLHHRVIPVINENDVVAVDEIQFGDNDHLAVLVTLLIPGDLLILLTAVDGVREPAARNRTRRIPVIHKITDELLAMTSEKSEALSMGGMASKIRAAHRAASHGIPVVIANGRSPGVLQRILGGEDVGTLVCRPGQPDALRGRKRWIAFFHKPQGELWLDAGACRALRDQGKSLLPIGIVHLEGRFPVGALVNVCDGAGAKIGQGLVDYASEDIERIKGRKTGDIASILGRMDYNEVVHRDNLVIDPDPDH